MQYHVEPNQILLQRNKFNGCWRQTGNGKDGLLREFPNSMVAGDVARAVAKANPGFMIGIASVDVGPFAATAFGMVVWLKPGFEEE